MLGILLVSHGDMAKGLLSSAKMFFGDDIENIDILCLYLDTPVEDFKEELGNKVKRLDDGDGVLILSDLLGGTPCNLSNTLASENVNIISGANLTMLVEVLGMRMCYGTNIDYDKLVETGRAGIIHTNLLNKGSSDTEEGGDFFS